MSRPTIEQFEAIEFEPGEFDHEAHIHVAWLYLQRYELLEAINRYRAGLRRIVKAFGAEGKYHETITWFFMISIAEQMQGRAAGDWEAFRAGCPELFEREPGWLRRHYSAERLASEQARTQFLLPDVA